MFRSSCFPADYEVDPIEIQPMVICVVHAYRFSFAQRTTHVISQNAQIRLPVST